MPYRKKYRKRRRRRRRRRKKRGMSIMRVPGIIVPDTTYVNLKFAQKYYENPATDIDSHIWGGNCLFDPDFAKSGAVCSGFAEWMAFYDHYQVISSTFKCTIVSMNANEFTTCLSAKNPASGTAVNPMIENPYSVNKTVGGRGNERSVATMKYSMGSKKILGRTQASVNYVGTATTNPNSIWYWQVSNAGLQLANPPATNIEYNIRVEIIYRVKLYDRPFIT